MNYKLAYQKGKSSIEKNKIEEKTGLGAASTADMDLHVHLAEVLETSHCLKSLGKQVNTTILAHSHLASNQKR